MSIGVALKDCRPKDQPHGLVETVGAGARKSGCFSDLLWWRVGRHGLLRFDADTFFGAGAFAYPSSCSLPLQAIQRRVRTACLRRFRSTAVRAGQALPATQYRSARQRQMAAHQPAHDGCGCSWSIDTFQEMLPTQGHRTVSVLVRWSVERIPLQLCSARRRPGCRRSCRCAQSPLTSSEHS